MRVGVRPEKLSKLLALYALKVKELQSDFSGKRQYMKEVFIKEGQNTVAKRLRDIPRAVEIMEEIQRIREARAELLEMGQSSSLQGSHAVTRVRLEELRCLENEYRRQLIGVANAHGITLRTGIGRKGVRYEN